MTFWLKTSFLIWTYCVGVTAGSDGRSLTKIHAGHTFHCTQQLEGVLLYSVDRVQIFSNIADAGTCCELCLNHTDCGAWSWGRANETIPGLALQCHLSHLNGACPSQFPKIDRPLDVVSGYFGDKDCLYDAPKTAFDNDPDVDYIYDTENATITFSLVIGGVNSRHLQRTPSLKKQFRSGIVAAVLESVGGGLSQGNVQVRLSGSTGVIATFSILVPMAPAAPLLPPKAISASLKQVLESGRLQSAAQHNLLAILPELKSEPNFWISHGAVIETAQITTTLAPQIAPMTHETIKKHWTQWTYSADLTWWALATALVATLLFCLVAAGIVLLLRKKGVHTYYVKEVRPNYNVILPTRRSEEKLLQRSPIIFSSQSEQAKETTFVASRNKYSQGFDAGATLAKQFYANPANRGAAMSMDGSSPATTAGPMGGTGSPGSAPGGGSFVATPVLASE